MKKLIAIILLALFAVTSCKKDPSTQILNNSSKNITTITTNTTTASYNITYHLWYPYHSLWTPNGSGTPPSNIPSGRDSLIIYLDSTTNHKITLMVGSYNAGPCSPSNGCYYNTFVDVISRSSDVYIATNSHGLVNDSINSSLSWGTSISLEGNVFMNGCIGVGDWGCGLSTSFGYIGVKIVSPSGNKYGWVKVSSSTNSIIMEAQALNNNYGQHIQAGQTH